MIKTHSSRRESTTTRIPLISSSGSYRVSVRDSIPQSDESSVKLGIIRHTRYVVLICVTIFTYLPFGLNHSQYFSSSRRSLTSQTNSALAPATVFKSDFRFTKISTPKTVNVGDNSRTKVKTILYHLHHRFIVV